MSELYKIAEKILQNGKGILAADESTGTMKKRLDSVNIDSNEKNQNQSSKINEYAGMSFTDITNEIRKRFDLSDESIGVVVVGVNDNSPSAERGIKPGDIIQKVDQVDINTSKEILKLVDEAKNKNKSSILFLIKRGLNARFIALPIN